MKKLLIVAAAALLASCGTITQGYDETITIVSEPNGAVAQITGLKNPAGTTCVTPCTVKVGRMDNVSVLFRKHGYRLQSVKLERTPSARGALSVGGNVIAGGVVGVAVDSATGAAYHHEPNPVIVTLDRCQRDIAPGDCINQVE